MPRGPRLDAPGAVHHVMARGIERREIFRTDIDRKDFLARLGRIGSDASAHVLAWALLPNHVHLLIRTGVTPLSAILRRLLTGYAITFNRRHSRCGVLFQNRFKSILIEEDPYLLELLRYIHLNPARAGLVASMEELERFPWTGHAALLGRSVHAWQATAPVLELFGSSLRTARLGYRRFVAEAWGHGQRPELQGGGLIRSLGGWQAARTLQRGRERWAFDERILGGSDFVQEMLAERCSQPVDSNSDAAHRLRDLLAYVAQSYGLGRTEVCGGAARRPQIVAARAVFVHVAVRLWGTTLARAAKLLNVSKQSAARALERGPSVLARRGLSAAEVLRAARLTEPTVG